MLLLKIKKKDIVHVRIVNFKDLLIQCGQTLLYSYYQDYILYKFTIL